MNNLTDLNQNSLNDEGKSLPGKKPYHAPTIKPYGSLADLVQAQPNVGGDGETVWADCTLT
ncbi:hypothetical protein BH09BAC6_BH09BAC6_18220 [soil metagenome]|jgi:hypothetical protein